MSPFPRPPASAAEQEGPFLPLAPAERGVKPTTAVLSSGSPSLPSEPGLVARGRGVTTEGTQQGQGLVVAVVGPGGREHRRGCESQRGPAERTIGEEQLVSANELDVACACRAAGKLLRDVATGRDEQVRRTGSASAAGAV